MQVFVFACSDETAEDHQHVHPRGHRLLRGTPRGASCRSKDSQDITYMPTAMFKNRGIDGAQEEESTKVSQPATTNALR